MKLRLRGFLSTVGSAATRERLTEDDINAPAVTFTAERSNTGYVYISDREVSSSDYAFDLGAGDSVTIAVSDLGYSPGGKIALRDIWLDVSVGGDGVSVAYLEE